MSVMTLQGSYQLQSRKRQWILLGLFILLLLSFIRDVATGPSGMTMGQVWQTLLFPAAADQGTRVIVFDVRLPYSAMALVVGGALGLAGAQMQTVLNNPLASPFTLGLAAASTLGASLAIVFLPHWPALPPDLVLPAAAFSCALGITGLILLLSRSRGSGSDTVVLFGIALLFGLEALVWLLQFLADSNALQEIVFWSMGSLGRARGQHVLIVAIALALCFVMAMRRAWALTLLRGGEVHAQSMGVAVSRLRTQTLIEVSLLTATALCFVGTIGFVGLVGPHIARLLVGEQHRVFLPASVLCGALMLSLASIASKAVIPGLVMPIGIVTAIVGVPVFILLILTKRSRV